MKVRMFIEPSQKFHLEDNEFADSPFSIITEETRSKMVRNICLKMSEPEYYTFKVISCDKSSEQIIMYKNDTMIELYNKVKEAYIGKRIGDHFAYATPADYIPPPGESPTFDIKDIFLHNGTSPDIYRVPKNDVRVSSLIREQANLFPKIDLKKPVYTIYMVDNDYYLKNYQNGKRKPACVIC